MTPLSPLSPPLTSDELPPLHDAERPHAWAVAYLGGTLPASERATFEAHLAEHPPCRDQVATLRAAFSPYDRVLMEDGPPKPIEDYVAYLEAAEARVAARKTADPKRDRGAEKTADAIGRLSRPQRAQPTPRAARTLWAWGAATAAVAAAAAVFLAIVQPFAGIAPQLLVVADQAPLATEQVERKPLPPPPLKLELSTAIRFGRLELSAPREPRDAYAAVAIVDAKHQRWLVQSGETADEACVGGCRPLELQVKLEALAPGPIRVAVALSEQPIAKDDFGRWLERAGAELPLALDAHAFGVATVDR